MTLHRYRLFGLKVDSEILLPDLVPACEDGPSEVLICYGSVGRSDGPESDGLSLSVEGATLQIPDLARYLIREGKEIYVEAELGAAERNIRLYLLGSAFGALLHQRALLPLHANIVDFDGVAVAFMGHSGAGKSTLASWFHDRGLPVLGDDVCVVRNDFSGAPVAEPGLPRMRLWADALRASGRQTGDYETSFDDMEKYDVPTTFQSQQALPLGAIYDLRTAEPDRSATNSRLTGVGAVHSLVANTYRGSYLPLMGGVERHLAQCVDLSRQVPVFELHRRWGLEFFNEEAAWIESEVRATLANAD